VRITSARDQVEMLAPWRTAADIRWVGPLNTPESGKGGLPGKQTIKYPEATQRVIDDVHAATGVKLDVENTGGNTYVLSGRCHEDGSWLVAGDAEDGCIHWDLAHRHREEAEGEPGGWYAAVYRNQVNGDGDEHWGFDHEKGHSVEPYHIHADEGAAVHELPHVIRETLATMPRWQMPSEPISPGRNDDLDEDFGHIFGSRTAAFKWLPSGGGPSDDGGEEAHTETGHLVQTHHAYPRGYHQRNADPVGWGYSIWELGSDPEYGQGYHDCVGENDGAYPTHDGAKKAAEEHYYQLDHSQGKAPESRVDYSDLNKFMGEGL
jgi:hypothetical protein